MEARDRIIVAGDVDSPVKALELHQSFRPRLVRMKFGLEFITRTLALLAGADSEEAQRQLQALRELFNLVSGTFFWDGKWHDIPNTTKQAMTGANIVTPGFVNVHASAGIDAMGGVVDANANSLVLAVTVLTSLEENDAHCIYGAPTKATVLQFARDAKLAGCHGIVCSPQELSLLKSRRELRGLVYVVPGVRPAWASTDDQKRVMTPGEAIKAGADYLVIGRPITKPPKEIGTPVDAFDRIIEEIEAANAEMASV